jgi:hypothetical protein
LVSRAAARQPGAHTKARGSRKSRDPRALVLGKPSESYKPRRLANAHGKPVAAATKSGTKKGGTPGLPPFIRSNRSRYQARRRIRPSPMSPAPSSAIDAGSGASVTAEPEYAAPKSEPL